MSLTFGGAVDHRVNLGSASMLDNIADFTYVMWFYPTTLGVGGGLITKGVSGSANRQSMERRNSVQANALFAIVDWTGAQDVTSESTANMIVADTWQCVAMTYDSAGTIIRLYYGTLIASMAEVSYSLQGTTPSGSRGDNAANDMFIGCNGSGTSGSLPQRIGAVEILNRILTVGELQSWQFDPRNLAGSLGFYRLGDNGTGTQPDLSGNSNAGTVTGATQSDNPPLRRWRRAGALYPSRPAVRRVRPVADLSDGAWLNELGSNVNLYASVDEVVPDDADYIRSEVTPSNSAVILQLGPLDEAQSGDWTLHTRARRVP